MFYSFAKIWLFVLLLALPLQAASKPLPYLDLYPFNRALTPNDLSGTSASERRLMRNAIFARRGRPFKDPTLARYFERKKWYRKDANWAPQDDDRKLSALEKRNAEFLLKFENARGKNSTRVSNSPARAEPREIKLTSSQKKKFNDYFSTFSGDVSPFRVSNLSDAVMIDFALKDEYNRGRASINQKTGKYEVTAKRVNAIAQWYFGRPIKKHRGVDSGNYRNGNYYISGWDGLPVFSQVSKLFDNGDGTLTAHVTDYGGVSLGWDGDVHGTNEDWQRYAKQNDLEDVPQVERRLKCLIKRVGSGAKQRYILLEYLKT